MAHDMQPDHACRFRLHEGGASVTVLLCMWGFAPVDFELAVPDGEASTGELELF